MPREIVKYGHPALRTPGKPVGNITEKIRELAEEMLHLMRKANGLGLAAQQVGEPLLLCWIDVPPMEDRPSRMKVKGQEVALLDWMPLCLINPEISLSKEKEIGGEGCLSFPEIHADIRRSKRVRVKARQLTGEPLEFECEGLLAKAVQHEVDHLKGVLFIDRMDSATKLSLKKDVDDLMHRTVSRQNLRAKARP